MQKVADPIVSEHFAKAGLGVVLIDQQHGQFVNLTIFKLLLATVFRSVGRADFIWVFAKAGEVPRLLPHGPGRWQHSGSHQVLSSCHIQYNSRSQLKIVLWYKSLPFLSRALDAGACGIVAPMINNREDAQRLVDQCRYLPPICTYLYLLSCMYLAPRAYIAGDTYLNASPGTLLKASVPGARQEPLLEISPHSRPMIMSRWGHPIFHLLAAFNQILDRCLQW